MRARLAGGLADASRPDFATLPRTFGATTRSVEVRPESTTSVKKHVQVVIQILALPMPKVGKELVDVLDRVPQRLFLTHADNQHNV